MLKACSFDVGVLFPEDDDVALVVAGVIKPYGSDDTFTFRADDYPSTWRADRGNDTFIVMSLLLTLQRYDLVIGDSVPLLNARAKALGLAPYLGATYDPHLDEARFDFALGPDEDYLVVAELPYTPLTAEDWRALVYNGDIGALDTLVDNCVTNVVLAERVFRWRPDHAA